MSTAPPSNDYLLSTAPPSLSAPGEDDATHNPIPRTPHSDPPPLTTASRAPRDLERGLHCHLTLLVEKRDGEIRGEDVDLAGLQAKVG